MFSEEKSFEFFLIFNHTSLNQSMYRDVRSEKWKVLPKKLIHKLTLRKLHLKKFLSTHWWAKHRESRGLCELGHNRLLHYSLSSVIEIVNYVYHLFNHFSIIIYGLLFTHLGDVFVLLSGDLWPPIIQVTMGIERYVAVFYPIFFKLRFKKRLEACYYQESELKEKFACIKKKTCWITG